MPHQIGRVIECDGRLFETELNERPFELEHTLKDHPLLQLPALIELAERMAYEPQRGAAHGDIELNQGVIETREPRGERSPQQRDYAARLLRFVDQADASITLRQVERQDGYRQIMEALVLDALSLAGPAGGKLLRRVETFEAIVLITSPNRVTEYHVDSCCSWIFQVHGSKAVHLFERTDKDVIPEEELERFYAVDRRALRYKPEYENRARVMHCAPGTGAHIPVNAPHWLRNGGEVSISLNLVFHLRDTAHAGLYRANHHLRRVGLRPARPGEHPRADRTKAFTAGMASRLGRALASRTVRIPKEAIEERRRILALVAARSVC